MAMSRSLYTLAQLTEVMAEVERIQSELDALRACQRSNH
jgi:hypothetical protein